MKSFRCVSLVLILGGTFGSARIAPAVTVLDLISHSEHIIEVALSAASSNSWSVKGVQNLKGASALPSGGVVVAVAAGDLAAVTNGGGGTSAPALWFVGDYDFILSPKDASGGLLHWNGRWFNVDRPTESSSWLLHPSGELNGVWDGATFLLAGAVTYVLGHPDVILPDRLQARWSDPEKIGHVAGPARSVMGIDLHRNGSLSLYVGSDQGDHIFRRQADREALLDTIPGSKSQAVLWSDLDGDGWLDFVSSRNGQLTGWWNNRDGGFRSNTVVQGDETFTGLAPWRIKGKPAAVLSAQSFPQLWMAGTNRAWSETSLLFAKSNWPSQLGEPRWLFVADFDNDSWPDVLQVAQRATAFYRGQADGTIASPRIVEAMGIPDRLGMASVADFNSDGNLDIVVGGPDGCRFWLGMGNVKFREETSGVGQLGEAAKRPCSGVAPGDINNDGWTDLILFHPDRSPTVFLNRGFASLQ
ncbi:MAG TPA: VCBS repeat-containing protein, partial [Verrucomicrobiae bacterium]|nr:VCBS repeat-containing protein [Verrucomicrobiae bacterium]